MKPSSELFKLINSMTKSEKRFFKLSSSLQSGEKNYLKIFDFIEKQTKYDEEDLKDFFKNERFVKHLPSEKNHLYRLILKSLRSFYSEYTISSLLKQEIKNVEILYNKALFKECEKFVSRAKEIAKENEKFYYWFELISWEKKLLEEAYEAGEFSVNLDDLVEEERVVIDKLRNLAEYQIIYSKINLIFRSGGFARNKKEREEVESIADYHLIKGKNTALSVRASSMCYYIKGLCAATNRNYSDAFLFFNKTRTILDNNPKIKEDSAQRYIMTLSHLCRCYIENLDFDLASELIQEIRTQKDQKGFNSMDIEVKIFTNSYNLEMKLAQIQGDFEKVVNLIPEIEEKQASYGEMINKEQDVLFNYNKAYSCFAVNQNKKALIYLNNVLNDNEQNLRQDLYGFARVFNLILHYELENYDFMEYIVKSTNRYLNKQERTLELETSLIKYLRKLSKTSTDRDKKELYVEFNKELIQLLKDENENVLLEYFNILAWVEMKLNSISFSKAVALGIS
ncbi:MAG: hypothetical protein WC044_03875 [Crocinitomicaceae bacterium]